MANITIDHPDPMAYERWSKITAWGFVEVPGQFKSAYRVQCDLLLGATPKAQIKDCARRKEPGTTRISWEANFGSILPVGDYTLVATRYVNDVESGTEQIMIRVRDNVPADVYLPPITWPFDPTWSGSQGYFFYLYKGDDLALALEAGELELPKLTEETTGS